MQPFQHQSGIVMPLNRSNVDTDMIIPKQFLKSIKRTGFGPYLFDELRYLDQGYVGKDCSQRPLNPDFILNQPRYKEASILLTRQNFGCGSSREHAPWALENFGFRVLIAPSFADIFFNNAFKNGLLLITLDEETVDQLFAEVEGQEGYRLDVNLERQEITTPSGQTISFEVDPFRKHCLLEGLDDIAITLEQADTIRQFESAHKENQPWLFNQV